MNLFDLYFTCIYIYNHIWWGCQGGTTGNYESKDRGLIRDKLWPLQVEILTEKLCYEQGGP